MSKTKTRKFRQDPNLLKQVIMSQAGTLWKAVLEGVMNAVDAGASRLEIMASQTDIHLVDNGRGFRTNEEIEEYFEVFGKPHTADEGKTYGRFRMGRGQLFAYGHNHWRSGKFSMDVNVHATKFWDEYGQLQYDLQDTLENVDGCRINVHLSRPLDRGDLAQFEEDLKLNAKFVPIEVFLNGTRIDHSSSSIKWDAELEEADIKYRQRSELVVYNQGVRVTSYANHHYGVGGDVVSKVPLKVNFARNEIMSDCPVWQKLQRLIRRKGAEGREVREQTRGMTEDDRKATALQLLRGELPSNESYIAKVFTDIAWQHKSLNSILQKGYGGRITVGPKMYDELAKRIHAEKLAFVLSPQTLQRFGVDTVEELVAICTWTVRNSRHTYDWKEQPLQAAIVLDYDELAAGFSQEFTLVDKKKWTVRESAVMDALNHSAQWLQWGAPEELQARRDRVITLGCSEVTKHWTDGKTYVALDRKMISGGALDLDTFFRWCCMVVHELCHVTPSNCEHEHDVDFFHYYHNWTMGSRFGIFVQTVFMRLPTSYQKENKRMSRLGLKRLDRAERVAAENQKINKETTEETQE